MFERGFDSCCILWMKQASNGLQGFLSIHKKIGPWPGSTRPLTVFFKGHFIKPADKHDYVNLISSCIVPLSYNFLQLLKHDLPGSSGGENGKIISKGGEQEDFLPEWSWTGSTQSTTPYCSQRAPQIEKYMHFHNVTNYLYMQCTKQFYHPVLQEILLQERMAKEGGKHSLGELKHPACYQGDNHSVHFLLYGKHTTVYSRSQ